MRIQFFFWPCFAVLVNDGIFKRWYSMLPPFRLLRVEVVHAENARRIFRRTMEPYALVWPLMRQAGPYEAISYPYVVGNDVWIKIRWPGLPGTMSECDCASLRPIQFHPRRTGVPANDPIEE